MGYGSPHLKSRKYLKKIAHRYARRHNVIERKDIKAKQNVMDYMDSDCCYWTWCIAESHNTKPLYKQINRETIRKWGDIA